MGNNYLNSYFSNFLKKRLIDKEEFKEIKRKLDFYTPNLTTTLVRLYELCFDPPPGSPFIRIPLGGLLYLAYLKRQELKRCYPLVVRRKTYLRLNGKITEKEYRDFIDTLALLGGKLEILNPKLKEYYPSFSSIKAKIAEENLSVYSRQNLKYKKDPIPFILTVFLIPTSVAIFVLLTLLVSFNFYKKG